MNDMFKSKCGECDKEVLTYATNKTGTLPVTYCGKVCEANAKYKKRFDARFK